MGFTTLSTFNTTDNKQERSVSRFDFALIVTMNNKTSRVTTGASELMELDAINTRIVKTLRQRIVFFD